MIRKFASALSTSSLSQYSSMPAPAILGLTRSRAQTYCSAARKDSVSLVFICSKTVSFQGAPRSRIASMVIEPRSFAFPILPEILTRKLTKSLHHIIAAGLARVTSENVAAVMQVSAENPMTGIDGRSNLLTNLAKALNSNPAYFGDDARPGHLIGTFAISLICFTMTSLLTTPSIRFLGISVDCRQHGSSTSAHCGALARTH